MQTIQIRKKVYTDIAFNPHVYEKSLRDELPYLSDTEIKESVGYMSHFYQKMSEFDQNTEDYLVKRNIVRQQLVYSEADEDANPNERFQSDVVILGKTRNWPRFKDVAIKTFYNKRFKFKNLSSPVELLESHRLATIYLESMLDPVQREEFVKMPFRCSESMYTLDIPFDISQLGIVSDLVKLVYGAAINVDNYYTLYKQLMSTGLMDAVYYITHGEKNKLKKLVNIKLGDAKSDIMQKNKMHQTLVMQSEFNLIKTVIAEELDNPQKYFDIINKNKIKNASQFFALVSATDKKKIEGIIEERVKRLVAKPCAHNEVLDAYMDLYKLSYPWLINERDKLKRALMEFLEFDEPSKQHVCTTCGQRVLCQHTFDLAGLAYKDKVTAIEKYKDPDDFSKKYSYCKYCHERIFRNELEEIMTATKFEDIVRSRAQTMLGDTQSAAFENGLYFGIANLIGMLKFDYEFVPRQLVKEIMNIVFNKVYERLSLLHAEKDLDTYEQLASMYGYIYAAMFMMKSFMTDPKINTPDKTRKHADDYGKYILTKVGQRFGRLTTPEQTKRLIYQAYVDLKEFGAVKIAAKSDTDHIVEVLQHPLFLFLYKMHLCGNPTHTTIEAAKQIITQPKPTIMNFYMGVKVPSKNVTKMFKDLYTFWLDYNSPKCYIFSLSERPTGAAKDLVYDPSLANELTKVAKSVVDQLYYRSYCKLISSTPVNAFTRCYGANYIYDDDGNLIIWSDKLDWTTKGGKTIKLEDIKSHVDESTPAKLQKRNQVIGYKEKPIKKIGTSVYKYVELPKPPDYEFNQRLLGIVSKIDNKYSPNILEYAGRTEGYDYESLIRGIIPGVERYTVGYSKIKYYCQLFIEKYYFLKNNPMNKNNENIINESGIDPGNIDKTAKMMADLDTKKYYTDSRDLENLWEPKKFYQWQVESLTKFIIAAEKSSVFGKLFVVDFLKFLIKTEKRLSLPNPKKLAGGYVADDVADTEYDESVDFAKKSDDDDEIDYEQDEDDINDDRDYDYD